MNRKDELKSLLDSDPKEPFLNYALAMEYLSEKDTESARTKLNWMKDTFPDYLPLYYQLASINIDLGHQREAELVIHAGIHLATEIKDLKTASELRNLLLQSYE